MTLIPGARGIFEIQVGGHVVATKTSSGFPDENAVVSAVTAALAA